MEWNKLKEDALKVILFSLYPMLELYGYFVFVGIFCLGNAEKRCWAMFSLFLVHHIVIAYKATFYLRLVASDGMSTLNLFSNAQQESRGTQVIGMNKFVEEEMSRLNASRIKTCNKCKTYKPPRAHHCDTCKRCYFKYDHHCALLGTCIALHNYKFFYQFLVLNLFSTIFFLTSVLIIRILAGSFNTAYTEYYIIFIALYSIELVSNLSLLFFHTMLINMNETTVEYYALNDYIDGDYTFSHVFQEGPIVSYADIQDRQILNPYNLGSKKNWIQVFGEKSLGWFTPIYSSVGNGVTFPKNYEEYELC